MSNAPPFFFTHTPSRYAAGAWKFWRTDGKDAPKTENEFRSRGSKEQDKTHTHTRDIFQNLQPCVPGLLFSSLYLLAGSPCGVEVLGPLSGAPLGVDAAVARPWRGMALARRWKISALVAGTLELGTRRDPMLTGSVGPRAVSAGPRGALLRNPATFDFDGIK